MTQEQLARLAHVPSRTIIWIETVNYNPSIMLAYRLALIFETMIEWLCCLKENLEEEQN